MGRYFKFDTYNFNFATRCDISWRKEYFMDFVFGGERSDRAYGLTRITPQLTAAYDVDGLYFLKNVIGSAGTTIPCTISVAETPQINTIGASVDTESAGILNAKVDTWEITAEEGNPVRAEFTCIGRNTTVFGAGSYSADFDSNVIMPSDCTLTLGASPVSFSLFSLRIGNGLQSIFKSSTLPVTIRATGLEITGRLRVPNYYDPTIQDNSISMAYGTIGTIFIGAAKFLEIPPRVTGYDLPETEYSYTGFPGAGITAIKAILLNTIKW